ncbi:MAG: YggU family protein [Gammaproteobacteria bacterium]|nr:YggU family protein [Gammaproteobacteria bacterium]
MKPVDWFRWDGNDLLLQVKVIPKSSSDELAGVQGDHMRVRITAPPVDGKANVHLVRWLAQVFGVSRSAITIEAGTLARIKRIRVHAPARLPDAIDPRPAH